MSGQGASSGYPGDACFSGHQSLTEVDTEGRIN